MGCCGGSNNAGAEARQLEAERQATITSGVKDVNKIFSGFTDDFYNQRARDYINFALPKLGMETRDTERAMKFSLANRSLSNSSAARQQKSSLARAVADAAGSIGTQAESESQRLRSDVEQQRSNVIAQLQASADPAVAGQQAINSAAQFTAPSTFAPVGGFLNNWANLWLADKTAKTLNQNTNTLGRSTNYGAPTAASYTVRN